MAAKALPGSPYDGHTLSTVIPHVESIVGNEIKRIIADKGYRGHGAPAPYSMRVFVSEQKRGVTKAIKRELKRRSAVEPRLLADLELAHGDGRFVRLFRSLTKVDLLILDDWGPDRLTAVQRRDPMEIVEDPRVHGRCLKRTKSLVGLNGPPGECPVVAKVWVLCHLIAVLLTEAQLSAIGDSPRRGPVLGRTGGGSTAS